MENETAKLNDPEFERLVKEAELLRIKSEEIIWRMTELTAKIDEYHEGKKPK